MKKTLVSAVLIAVIVSFTSSYCFYSEKDELSDRKTEDFFDSSVSVLREEPEITVSAAENICNIISDIDSDFKVDYLKKKIDDDGLSFYRIFSGTEFYDIYLLGINVAICSDEDGNICFLNEALEAEMVRISYLKSRIVLKNISYNVKRGDSAFISVGEIPTGIVCNIEVRYSSGNISSASGLESKTADNNGEVSWKWNVGGSTSPGIAEIKIYGDDFLYKYEINIVE